MTLDEARALLQVDGDTARSEIRRAYLRAIKGASPERDPERFMLLREAFELLRRAPDPDAPRVEADGPWERLRAMERAPRDFDDETIVTFARAHGDELGLDAVALLLDRELFAPAYELALRTIEQQPPAARMLMVLYFYREERRADADELFALHGRAASAERPLVDPDVQVLSLLTGEVHGLPQWFPPAAHSLLAHGAILGEPVAFEEVVAQVRGGFRRRRVERVLIERVRYLIPDRNLESYGRERMQRPLAWALVIAVFAIAILGGMGEGRRATEGESRRAYEASGDRIEAVVDLCELEPAPACRRAIAIGRAAQAGDCRRAIGMMDQTLWSYEESARFGEFTRVINEMCATDL